MLIQYVRYDVLWNMISECCNPNMYSRNIIWRNDKNNERNCERNDTEKNTVSKFKAFVSKSLSNTISANNYTSYFKLLVCCFNLVVYNTVWTLLGCWPKIIDLKISIFNPFQSNVPFLYSLKTSENQRFLDIFKGI